MRLKKIVCRVRLDSGYCPPVSLPGLPNFPIYQLSNFFLQLSKQKTSYLCGVFGATKCERKHANQQFNTYLLICKQTRKIYEHSHRPMCQYIAPCVITGLNVIGYSQMLIKNNYYMLFIFCSKPLEVHEWYRFELVIFVIKKIETKCEK